MLGVLGAEGEGAGDFDKYFSPNVGGKGAKLSLNFFPPMLGVRGRSVQFVLLPKPETPSWSYFYLLFYNVLDIRE